MASVSQYFNKKRAAALGYAVAGSSIGGVVFPIALSKMLNSSSLGFGWSVRIVGFMMLAPLGFACIAIKPRLPPRQTNFFLAKAFKEMHFNLLTTSMFFIFIGMFTPLFFIPTYAMSRGMGATLASYLLAMLNGASTFGRIIPGIIADRYGRLNILGAGGVLTALIIFCLNKAETNAELIVYSIAIGFTSGTVISGGSAAYTVIPKDPRDMGTYMGMGLAIGSLAALIGPPINGALADQSNGFLKVSIFSGSMCMFGGILVFVTKIATPKGIFGKA